MAKLSKKELEDIVERDMPGYRLARQAAAGQEGAAGDAAADHADATTPSLNQLRQKYLSSKYGVADSARPQADADGGEHNHDSNLDDDDEIVTVEPTNATHPWDVTARPKVVVVSGREKRIAPSVSASCSG